MATVMLARLADPRTALPPACAPATEQVASVAAPHSTARDHALTEHRATPCATFFTFELCRQVFAVPAEDIRGVFQLSEAVPVLQPPDYGTGYVTLAAGVLPLVDLRVKVSGCGGFTPTTRILSVVHSQADGRADGIGLVVDRVIGHMALPRSSVLRTAGPLAATTPFVVGWLNAEGIAVPLLAVEQLFERRAKAAERPARASRGRSHR